MTRRQPFMNNLPEYRLKINISRTKDNQQPLPDRYLFNPFIYKLDDFED
jgi:hypothetical protein